MSGQRPSPDLRAEHRGDHHGGVLTIRDPETLRLISDPFRLRMLELVREEPRTAKEMAAALRVSQTRLYYHIKLLEEHGLIAVAETRLVSGIVEKRYRATAYRLTVDKSLIGETSEGGDALDTYLSVVLDEVRGEINRSIDAGLIDLDRTEEDAFMPRRLVLGRKWFRATPEQIADFARRYTELMNTLEQFDVEADLEPADLTGSEGQLYEWLIAFYPTLPPAHSDSPRQSTPPPPADRDDVDHET